MSPTKKWTHFRDAAAAFVVFDLTRASTFDAAAKWKADLDMKVWLGNCLYDNGLKKPI